MRKIDESDYDSFRIEGYGWSVVFMTFRAANSVWSGMPDGDGRQRFIGIKLDGQEAIIDTK